MLDFALSLMMLAALALCAGAVFLWRRGERKRPALMVFMALILGANIAIWTIPDARPDAGSAAPVAKVPG